ncbi:LysM repeat protein [Hydrogenispora ethanolica]|uniref:LysM repeat protein n=1 Tax=Hydrogenispora ethanolica TaxID=1082276 RepID=A0A4R1RZT4_HYDET|nr:LysM peptidoglycan-binding domain-containing protein [Hydrogenispora ethanolica]TCL72328.1 LysM repeat protein [Hydrogenispora ethanolica]
MSIHNHSLYPEADPPCPAGSAAHTVRAGDTFYSIAQRLGTTVAAIAAFNPGVNPNALRVGQSLCVPGTGAGPSPGTCSGTRYTIRSGDTFYTLAARYGVTVQAITAANPGVNPSRLTVGQTICIPGTAPQQPALIPTPFCSLLRPVLAVIPPDADIPIGSATVRQVAMSTRAYTIAAAPLPNPSAFGDYDSYAGVLSLITDNPAAPRETVTIRLVASGFGDQLITWSGTTITAWPPIVGDTAEIRPLNTGSGSQGSALLHGDLLPCQG